jgi:hypothetical protein
MPVKQHSFQDNFFPAKKWPSELVYALQYLVPPAGSDSDSHCDWSLQDHSDILSDRPQAQVSSAATVTAGSDMILISDSKLPGPPAASPGPWISGPAPGVIFKSTWQAQAE